MSLTGKIFFQKTYYEVLSVKEDASYDEIKASYKSTLLNSHPDKLRNKYDASRDHHELDFLEVQKAWEVLSDSKSRANYNKELQTSRLELEIPANEVELGDMSVKTVGDLQELFYECSCGDYFSITSLELREMGILLDKESVKLHSFVDSKPASVLIPCGSCSLKIHLSMDHSP